MSVAEVGNIDDGLGVFGTVRVIFVENGIDSADFQLAHRIAVVTLVEHVPVCKS